MLCTPKSCISAQHLTVGQANLTVERGCSHCKQYREVERSGARGLSSRDTTVMQCRRQRKGKISKFFVSVKHKS